MAGADRHGKAPHYSRLTRFALYVQSCHDRHPATCMIFWSVASFFRTVMHALGLAFLPFGGWIL
jgi:hypothetical protein